MFDLSAMWRCGHDGCPFQRSDNSIRGLKDATHVRKEEERMKVIKPHRLKSSASLSTKRKSQCLEWLQQCKSPLPPKKEKKKRDFNSPNVPS